MIRWLIACAIGVVILSLLFRNEVEGLRDSEAGQSPLPSVITLAKDGDGSESQIPSLGFRSVKMIRWSIAIGVVVLSVLFQFGMESLRGSENGQSRLPSEITLAKDGEGSEQRSPSSSSSSFPMLSDHICELYRPNGQPAMEILFFHGLQLENSTDPAYLSTWRTRDGSQQIWPATWLAEQFSDAHIFSVKYDSSMKTTPEKGRLDLFRVAENLRQDLCSANIGQGNRRPVILVGHSFGGLVMKQLCVDAHHAHQDCPNPDSENNRKIGNFLRNVRGHFFYGTPHHGIPGLSKIAGRSLDSPLLVYVEFLSAEAARLESSFDTFCKNFNIRVAGVGESHETSWGAFQGLVVREASARYGTDFSTVGADHFSLSKPTNKTSNSFGRLINFIRPVYIGDRLQDLQRLPEGAVGLDLRVEEVQKKLQKRTRVGIFGMGGVGKTTVARAVFNRLCSAFEYTCFCADVKLTKANSGSDLKKRIWEDLHCGSKKMADKQDEWSKLRGKRLLLVLDDVDHDAHVEALLDISHKVAADSIFLMTSRERDILKFKLDDEELYEVPFLSANYARLLFLSHAFPNQAGPPPALETHVNDVLMKCEGLPLTLKVLGSCLRGVQDVKVWKEALDTLGKAGSHLKLNERLWEKLRVSYNRLEKDVQHMFLDATTFFSSYAKDRYRYRLHRWTLVEAKAAWSAIYGSESLGWKALVDASLVYDVKEDEPIKVHEQLLSLGRKIASEDATKSVRGERIWEGTEGWKALQSTEASDHQEIHSLNIAQFQRGKPFNIPRTSLSRLKNLQYLDVYDGAFETLFIDGAQENERLQTNLVILRSPSLHFGHIHFDLALPHLAVLKLTCYDQQYLPSSFGHLPKLKILEISNARLLKTLPQSFGDLSSLNYFQLSECNNLHSLPESFGGLSALTYLEIVFCANLQTLPESFGGLSALTYLEIRHCFNLQTLPESFGGLSALNHLEITSCDNFQTLPESFGGLSALTHLEIRHCFNLQTLPESFGGLSALNHLEITYCDNLTTLPVSFGQLKDLNYLEVSRCQKLERFPDSFSQLKALRHLTIRALPLGSIPEYIKSLPSLQILELGFLPYLQGLPPWFQGQMSPAPPNHSQKFSRTQEGYFVLEDLKQNSDWEFGERDTDWWWRNLHKNVMDKVRALDYAGALEDCCAVHLQFVDTDCRPFILQERGILKRLLGNLVGALEDLTAALEIGFERGKDDYECRKHRGYVKYLLGDISGARTDAERALAIWSERALAIRPEGCRLEEYGSSENEEEYGSSENEEESGSSENQESQIEAQNLEEHPPGLRDCLGLDPVNFLDFKLK